MKIFIIKSDSLGEKVLGYLLYYEKSKDFYIELPDDIDEWDAPMLLSSFVKKDVRTVNAYWSKVWVQQRIIPVDRQNLGSILRENDLTYYDEFTLLLLSEGRCAQDDCYIVPISEDALPPAVIARLQTRIEEIVPLEDRHMLVFFRDGSARRCDMKKVCDAPQFSGILIHRNLFFSVRVQTDGYGITWGENLDVASDLLYQSGELLPVSLSDFQSYAASCITDTAGACQMLSCSRQNISDLVRRKKLHPIRSSAAGSLFLMKEIRGRLWE